MKGNPTVILLVEDDEAHAILEMRILEEAKAVNKVYWVKDGKEALDYLFRRGGYADKEKRRRPDLILLAMELPKLDGHGVLKAIKESVELRIIPVVVLTSSESEADMTKAYQHHANSYLVKSANFKQFRQMMEYLVSYWSTWNQHPRLG